MNATIEAEAPELKAYLQMAFDVASFGINIETDAGNLEKLKWLADGIFQLGEKIKEQEGRIEIEGDVDFLISVFFIAETGILKKIQNEKNPDMKSKLIPLHQNLRKIQKSLHDQDQGPLQ